MAGVFLIEKNNKNTNNKDYLMLHKLAAYNRVLKYLHLMADLVTELQTLTLEIYMFSTTGNSL